MNADKKEEASAGLDRASIRVQPRSSAVVHSILLIVVTVVLIWSGIFPRDRFTWYLEVAPGVIGIVILAICYRRFRFTTLVYTLVALHACLLFVGGHYTYAEVPAFNWLRDHFHLSRNHFDRLGHFMQGFAPAMLAREVLIRKSPLARSRWLGFLVFCICMTISAIYEEFEWITAVLSGSSADAFLGGQGDPWDTNKDMAMCFIGSLASLIWLSKGQDRQLLGIPFMRDTSDADLPPESSLDHHRS